MTRTVTKRISKKPLVRNFYYATGEWPIGFDSSDAPGVGWRYVYDGLGRRVAKETVDTQTGETIARTVFVHAGGELAGECVTVGADAGCGYVWTRDPATGEVVGQTQLTPHGDPAGGVRSWSQERVDAEFYAIVADLAGAPQEIIDPNTGVVCGRADASLYGRRTWRGAQSCPLLFAGQYQDVESGWVYNRFRFYDPHAGVYNAQDPLGVGPNTATAQGYVHHPGHWVDAYGLKACRSGLPQLIPGTGMQMKRYGSVPVGGHHVPAKATYNNLPNSRRVALDAPAIPIDHLRVDGVEVTGDALHKTITANQRIGYDRLAASYRNRIAKGETASYTWDDVREVEIFAHVESDFTHQQAANLVYFGIAQIKEQGIARPTNIPWNKDVFS